MINWTEQTVQVKDLVPYEKNPRQISDKAFKDLVRSIKEDGYHQRIVANKDLTIVGGHQRKRALQECDITEVQVLTPDTQLSEEQFDRINIRDNLGYGEFDMDMLANHFDIEDLLDWGMDESLLPNLDIDIIEPAIDEDQEFETPEEPTTVQGDIYEIGPHRLMCGDSTNIDAVDTLMDGNKADMVFTDPPYGIGIDGQKESKSKNPKHNRKHHEKRGWDSQRPDDGIFDYIVSLGVPSTIYGGNYFADLLPPTRGWVYWSKGQDGLTMSDGELAWTNIDKPLRCVTVNRGALGNTVHPTQKPLQVIEHAFEYMDVDGSVLDLFGGSGSTMVASHKTNRTCYMMELDPKYCDVIVKRMKTLYPDIDIKLNGEMYDAD